jgi:hypothetical protein
LQAFSLLIIHQVTIRGALPHVIAGHPFGVFYGHPRNLPTTTGVTPNAVNLRIDAGDAEMVSD